jgi:hypothetical protein
MGKTFRKTGVEEEMGVLETAGGVGMRRKGSINREQEMRGERGAIEGKEVRRGERERLGLSRGR